MTTVTRNGAFHPVTIDRSQPAASGWRLWLASADPCSRAGGQVGGPGMEQWPFVGGGTSYTLSSYPAMLNGSNDFAYV